MKHLMLIATLAITAVSTADSFAGSCRIAPSYDHHRPVCQPEPHCRIAVLPPVCPPVRNCYIRPQRPVCPPPIERCRITVCLPEPPRCVIAPPKQCHKCPGHVCHCHKPVPTCRIKPCEPVHQVCRIRPCQPVEIGYPAPPQPTLPPQPPVELPELQTGQEVTIDGQQFGSQPGRVAVQIGGLTLEAQVTGWSENQVRAVIPTLPLTTSAQATVAVVNVAGQVADQLDILLVPQTQALASR